MWNHRVVKFEGPFYNICEVYYDKNGKPNGRNHGSTASGGSIEELRKSYKMIADAFSLPILNEKEFQKNV